MPPHSPMEAALFPEPPECNGTLLAWIAISCFAHRETGHHHSFGKKDHLM